MVIRIYKFCSVSRSLSTLTRTLGKSAKFLVVLIVLFLIAAFGFAMATLLILGQDNYHFSSVNNAMFTLLLAGFGTFDQTEWMSHRFLGPALLLSWLFFANSFLLNIVVAVICEAFVEVTEENKEAQEAGHMNLLDALWDLGPVRRLMQMNQAKRDKIEKLETALSNIDLDGNGQTDMDELEAWLHKTDAAELFGVADASELMKKFDKDGTGLLDPNEIARLKEFVQEKRQGLEREMEDIIEDKKSEIAKSEGNSRPASGHMFRRGGGSGVGRDRGAMDARILKIEQTVIGVAEQMSLLTEMWQEMAANGMSMAPPGTQGRAMSTISSPHRAMSTISGPHRGGLHTSSRPGNGEHRNLISMYNGDAANGHANGNGTIKATAAKTIVDE